MLTHKYIDVICVAAIIAAVMLTLLFMNGEALGIKKATSSPPYASRLFDESRVHKIDIIADDYAKILDNPSAKEYIPCTVVIDGERYENVALRAKGNNSLKLTEKYGLTRYSLKLEFDHYVSSTYHGLDKLSLDASFQDNSYLKTALVFDMMRFMGVPTPLTSFAEVTLNGEPHGLFLAIEEPEEAFCKRNFGSGYGELYKPDYKSLSDENADVALKYTGDDFESYDNIFRKARFSPSDEDKARLISSLKTLASGENLESAVDIDEALRYFTVQVFVVNLDSYLGRTGHNYFLYEEDGILQILPWDYNLAFATYTLGMPDAENNPTKYINLPIDTPAEGSVMLNRPLYHNLMQHNEIFAAYHAHFDDFLSGYLESGRCEARIRELSQLIAPYVERDASAFCSYDDHKLAVEALSLFCELRAESVRGQLDGTIPSTIKAQSADSSSFIDASQLDLPALGELADLKD